VKKLSNITLANKLRVRAKNLRHILMRLTMELTADQFEFGKITVEDALKANEKLDKFADTDFHNFELILDAFEILKISAAQFDVICQILENKTKFRTNYNIGEQKNEI